MFSKRCTSVGLVNRSRQLFWRQAAPPKKSSAAAPVFAAEGRGPKAAGGQFRPKNASYLREALHSTSSQVTEPQRQAPQPRTLNPGALLPYTGAPEGAAKNSA